VDVRVRYVTDEARLLEVRTAEAQYWQNHVKALEQRISQSAPPSKPAPRPAAGECRAVGQVFQDLPIDPQMVGLPSGSFLMGSAPAHQSCTRATAMGWV
jgi:formylglycine-generating enzyme required for sulfatase activity